MKKQSTVDLANKLINGKEFIFKNRSQKTCRYNFFSSMLSEERLENVKVIGTAAACINNLAYIFSNFLIEGGKPN